MGEKCSNVTLYSPQSKAVWQELQNIGSAYSRREYVQKKYEKLSRKLFLLWEFLAVEGLCQEAREYLEEHKDEEMPMDFSFILE